MALALANSPLETLYTQLLDLPLAVQVGRLAIAKPLLLWVNEGPLAIFFMLVGLEIKRAVVEGKLSSLSNAALPVIAAIGGMARPALVYIGCNWDDTEALRVWGIPTATDIAFVLGVLVLLGSQAAAFAEDIFAGFGVPRCSSMRLTAPRRRAISNTRCIPG